MKCGRPILLRTQLQLHCSLSWRSLPATVLHDTQRGWIRSPLYGPSSAHCFGDTHNRPRPSCHCHPSCRATPHVTLSGAGSSSGAYRRAFVREDEGTGRVVLPSTSLAAEGLLTPTGPGRSLVRQKRGGSRWPGRVEPMKPCPPSAGLCSELGSRSKERRARFSARPISADHLPH
jgi:hypothetical protein